MPNKRKEMSYRHRLFIKYYTDPESETFLNGAATYRKVYKIAKKGNNLPDNANILVQRLLTRDDIKIAIANKFEDFTVSKGEFLAKVEKLKKECKKETSLIRLLELEGKASNLLKENEIQVNTAVFNDAQKKLKDRLTNTQRS